MDLLRYGYSTVLSLNRRNSREVAQETTMLAAPRVPSVEVTSGVPVEYVWYTAPSEQPKRLRNLLYQLYDDGVSAGRVTVLSPRFMAHACFARSMTQCSSRSPSRTCSTWSPLNAEPRHTRRYLRSRVWKTTTSSSLTSKVLTATGGGWSCTSGMSRARAGPCLLVPNSIRPSYEACLRRSTQAALSGDGRLQRCV